MVMFALRFCGTRGHHTHCSSLGAAEGGGGGTDFLKKVTLAKPQRRRWLQGMLLRGMTLQGTGTFFSRHTRVQLSSWATARFKEWCI